MDRMTPLNQGVDEYSPLLNTNTLTPEVQIKFILDTVLSLPQLKKMPAHIRNQLENAKIDRNIPRSTALLRFIKESMFYYELVVTYGVRDVHDDIKIDEILKLVDEALFVLQDTSNIISVQRTYHIAHRIATRVSHASQTSNIDID